MSTFSSINKKNKILVVVMWICFLLVLSSFFINAIATPNYPIYTITSPDGTSVSDAYIVTGEFSTATLSEINTFTANTFPNATRVRFATGKYNCHSYAWYSQASSNNIWIDYNTPYKTDATYSIVAIGNRLTVPSQAPIGSIVDYPNDNHSARKYSSTKLISKWGNAGLMIHSPDYCPYPSSTSLAYYN